MAGKRAAESACNSKLGRMLQGKVDYEFVIRTGEVVSEILAAIGAFEVDLIVIPTHGRRGLKKVLLGSVAEQVIRESPVPVLTLRARRKMRTHLAEHMGQVARALGARDKLSGDRPSPNLASPVQRRNDASRSSGPTSLFLRRSPDRCFNSCASAPILSS